MTMKKVNCGKSEEVRHKILEAYDQIAGPVCKTLGPGGQTVILKNIAGQAMITKDGVTVANSITLEDPELDLIISIIKEAADKTNAEAGDGTTTATAISYEIFKEGMKYITSGHSPVDLQRQILSGIGKIVDKLGQKALKIDGNRLDILKKISAISMNGETEVSDLVAQAVDTVGVNGTIGVDVGRTNRWVRQQGLRINKGWASPYFCMAKNAKKITLENPYILITSHELKSAGQFNDLVENVLNKCSEARRPVLFISSGIDTAFQEYVLGYLAKGTLISCAILPPYFGVVRREFFYDLAALTGASVVEKDAGHQLAAVRLEHLGQVERVEITGKDTILIGGKGEKADFDARIKKLEQDAKDIKDNDLDKVVERLANLTGGIGVVELMRFSDVEFEEKKHRVEDAANACKAALEEGYVPGGGAALYRTALEVLDDKIPGEKILQKACGNVIELLASNAGLPGGVISDQVGKWGKDTFTVDIRKRELVNALDAGIIDPVKVVKSALINGGSVAASLLTTGAIISDVPDKHNSILEPYSPY